ncbi:hypothetical protein [Bombella saccharophila]|uniref:UrcA family protein n=1 Tax=Bombella saccharophila TaxID=2967338 RepID=A0ABT3W6Q2_9PROT|nr:hypothetical protein [Bombella saccharophila]MCX5614752.1 hypothetical protein [Bombella saccharophila]PHI96655.1 hypothetical protein BG621_02530 [Parasaccharibacter apium]
MRTICSLTALILVIPLTMRPNIARASLLSDGDSSPPPQDLVITSDSPAYCAQLSEHLAEKIRTPHNVPVGAMDDAQHLLEEGRELCQQNHIRAGIGRLRRALVLLKNQEEGPRQ